MENSLKKRTKELLKEKGIYPKKSLGQSFLISEDVLKKIIEESLIEKSDSILEIGAGTGNITSHLSQNAKEVVALEKDENLCSLLRDLFLERKNIKVVEGDALEIDISSLFLKDYKVVSNLPYYIATPLIRKFIREEETKPKLMTLVIQLEVAQRMVSHPPKMNYLSVITNSFSKVEMVKKISRHCFWPTPGVSSAIIKITPFKNPPFPSSLKEDFLKIVEAGFRHPRKRIVNNLFLLDSQLKSKVESKKKIASLIREVGISPDDRPERLSVESWVKLTKVFNEKLH